jgi:protein ImuB
MHAVILLPKFRLQAVLRWREAEGPVAVIDGSANKGLVLEATEAAVAFGVGPGVSSAQAMARCETLRLLARVPAQERTANAALVEAALSFSPKVEWTADGVATVDLWNASRTVCWQQLGERMIGRLAAVNLRGCVGVAKNPDHAMLAARCASAAVGGLAEEAVCVVRDAGEFFARLPLEVLVGSGGDFLTVLEDWGVRTVGEFAKLPKEAVIERLGASAGLMWQRIGGRSKRVLRLVSPPEEYGEAFEFELPVETTEPVLFLLRRFVDSLGSRLREAGRVAGRMTLTLPVDGAAEVRRVFSVPAPTTDAAVLFRILDTYLETLKLEAQPTGVRLEIGAERPMNCQLQLFGQGLRDPNRFGETLARLQAVVGENAVGVPRAADTWRPGAYELAGTEGLDLDLGEEDSAVVEERVGLPLRRVRGGGMEIRKEDVVRSVGPYRVSGDWWEDGWVVEEWDAELRNGEVVRVVKRGGAWVVAGGYEGESPSGRLSRFTRFAEGGTGTVPLARGTRALPAEVVEVDFGGAGE